MLTALLHRPATLYLAISLLMAAALSLADLSLSPGTEIALVIAAATLAGLPHGAADGWIAGRWGLTTSPVRAVRFFAAYIGLALAVIIVWQVLPVASLGGFLLISAWHFGDDTRSRLPPIARLASGTLILSAPALFHPHAVTAAYLALSGEGAAFLVSLQQWLMPVAATALMASTIINRASQPHRLHALDMALLVTLAALLSPYLYFAVYFCGVHAPRHFHHMLTSSGARPDRLFWIMTGLLTLITVAAGLIAFLVMSRAGFRPDIAGLQILVIGLAALTLPHMILIDGLSPRLSGRRSESTVTA